MEMTNFNEEFVIRTREIVSTKCIGEFKYDVTLLINCLLGLICLPIEHRSK